MDSSIVEVHVQEILAHIKELETKITAATTENAMLKSQLAAAKDERKALVGSMSKVHSALGAMLSGEPKNG